ncbi:MAG: 7-cyano-7-deazaguanine synthase [Candidatus Delongbacteria bacterium]|nr:7-cyano-7-deazaguanine synthase [Candidatus Delongbacteria bacterium]
MDRLKIDLKYNKGYSWYIENNFYFKGYVFDNEQSLEGRSAVKYIKESIYQNNDIEIAVSKLNGIFSLIYKSYDQLIICVDRVRTFPLFYSAKNERIIISDDAEACLDETIRTNKSAKEEFQYTGYVTGDNTLIEDVSQVQAGELVYLTPQSRSSIFYHEYLQKNDPADQVGTDKLSLSKVFTDISHRLKNSLKGKTPVIPLSGGYDSRLIAVMLKERGVEDAVCFTYGRKDNPEIDISRKVARSLGYKWHFIEYTPELIKGYIQDDDFKEYYRYSSNHTSMFYMQEYFAVRELKKLIPANSVFIPGHSGDFFGGSHLDKQIALSKTENEIVDHIIRKHFVLMRVKNDRKNRLKKRIKHQISGKNDNVNYSYFENWDLKERQAKFVVNSSRIYEHFGFQHLLPLMDNELMDFFAKTNLKQKMNKILYNKVIVNGIFHKYDLNFTNEIQAKRKDIRIQKLKETVKKILPSKIVDKYKYKLNRIGDTYYYIEITDLMKKELMSKNINIDVSGRDKNSIIVQWYLHKLETRGKCINLNL